MNVFAKFDEIPSMILQDIKETKRYGHTVGLSGVKTVYPPTNTVYWGYNYPEITTLLFQDQPKIFFTRGIKHDFPFINICKVPREVLKTFPRDFANVNE